MGDREVGDGRGGTDTPTDPSSVSLLVPQEREVCKKVSGTFQPTQTTPEWDPGSRFLRQGKPVTKSHTPRMGWKYILLLSGRRRDS